MFSEAMLNTAISKERKEKEKSTHEKVMDGDLNKRQILKLRGIAYMLDRVSDELPSFGVDADNVGNFVYTRDKAIQSLINKKGIKAGEYLDFYKNLQEARPESITAEELHAGRLLDKLKIDGKILSPENIEIIANYDSKKNGDEFSQYFKEEMEQLSSEIESEITAGTERGDKDLQEEYLVSSKAAIAFLYNDFLKHGINDELIGSVLNKDNRKSLSPQQELVSSRLLESAAEEIHNNQRNQRLEKGYDENSEDWSWAKPLMVDYKDLSEAEKEKKRKIFKIALQKYTELKK